MSMSRFHVHFGLGALRPGLVLTLLAGAYAVFNPNVLNTAKLLTFWPAKVMLALGVLACFSAAFGISLGASATFILGEYAKTLIHGFLLIAAIRHARDLKFMVWSYVGACGVLGFFATFVFRLRTYGGYARLSSLYTFDSNDAGLILAVGLPLTLLAFQTSKSRGRLAAALVLVGIAVTLARTGSRGGFLALLAVGAALLFWTPGVSAMKRVAFVAVAALGLFIAAPQGYWDQMRTITDPKEDYNWDTHYGRRKLAERGIGYMLRFPVFGVGVGNFPRADATLSERAINWEYYEAVGAANRWRAVHNSYVQAGSEMGVPGLLLWSSLVFGSIVAMRRLRRRLPRGWLSSGDPDRRFLYLATVYLPVALIGFAVGSFFVSFAYIPLIYVLAAFVVGVYTSVDAVRREEHAALAGSPTGRAPAEVGPARPAVGGGTRRPR